jgi:hypothetical protein
MGLATERFLELLAVSAYDQTRKDARKTVTYKDLATAVRNVDQFEFLDQVCFALPFTVTKVLPMQVNFGDALVTKKEIEIEQYKSL